MEKRSDTEGIQMNWKSRRRGGGGGGLEYSSRLSRNCRFPLPVLLHLSIPLFSTSFTSRKEGKSSDN